MTWFDRWRIRVVLESRFQSLKQTVEQALIEAARAEERARVASARAEEQVLAVSARAEEQVLVASARAEEQADIAKQLAGRNVALTTELERTRQIVEHLRRVEAAYRETMARSDQIDNSGVL